MTPVELKVKCDKYTDHLTFLFSLRPPGVPERPAYMHLPLPLSLPPSPQIGNVILSYFLKKEMSFFLQNTVPYAQ